VMPHLAWMLLLGVLHLRGRRRVVAVARARHEVRGPLAVARLALGGLERSARVEAIDFELRRAARALEDLDGARSVDAARRVDVGRLLADAAPAWTALAEEFGSALVVEPAPLVVEGDPLRLAQACANLVANAIEHGGGHVRVRVTLMGGHVRVEVRDDGPGLPAPLTVLVGSARGRRSHRGHGLAIVAAIARRHHGRLLALPSCAGAHLVLELPEAPPTPARRRSFATHLRRGS